MDEIGKFFAAVSLIAVGAFCIILSFILGILNMIAIVAVGAALCGFGSVIYYVRHISISSQTRVKKVKTTRTVRDVPLPKPKPVGEEPIEEEKPKEPEILCDTCQHYDIYNTRQKCKFLTNADRMKMINAGLECVEYKIKLSLLDEE
ncbi:MAG TPA: hypothetical protein VMV49_04295 [Candidatus Deferrimicrobium sp.]|nr:hypothetical protein [Candidatus Deferrimicrobium sp.]